MGAEYVLTGEGDFPLHELKSALQALQYDRFLSFEWEKKWHPELADAAIALPHFAQLVSQELRMTESNDEILRTLRAEDIPAAFQLSAQAGWNQTEEDWRTLLELAPEDLLRQSTWMGNWLRPRLCFVMGASGMDRNGADKVKVSTARLCAEVASAYVKRSRQDGN